MFGRPAAAANASPDLSELGAAPFVFGVGQCPTSSDVERAVMTRMPEITEDVERHRVRVELEDSGATHSVTVFKDGARYKKSFTDTERNCEQRVRFAAVFVILTIRPPAIALGDEPPPEPVPEPEPPPPPPETDALEPPEMDERDEQSLAVVELGALLDLSPRWLDAPSVVSYGGELRVALGPGRVAGVLSVGYFPASNFAFERVEGRMTRAPGTLGLRLRSDPGSFEWALDASALLLLERVEATNLVFSSEETLLEIGARATLLVSYRFGPAFAPFAGLSLSAVPAPRELRALPEGTLGTTPPLWFGATIGMRLSL